jgi:hypothetical protein
MIHDWMGELLHSVSEKKQEKIEECPCETETRKVTFRGKALCPWCLRAAVKAMLEEA